MLLREVAYARPSTVDEAVALLAGNEGARALAGGQTLINVMKARVTSPEVLVDLADLEELRSIGFSTDGLLEIGAMVTYAQLMASSEVDVARPILAEVASTIGDAQVRNRGTVGGNVCVADPTNHLPPLFAVLEATFTISGAGGERTVSADDFFQGVYLTAVREGELLTKVSVPPSKGAGDGFAGLTIGKQGTYVVNAAATVSDDDVRIAIGCVAATPVRADCDGGEADGRLLGGRRPRRGRGSRCVARPAGRRARVGGLPEAHRGGRGGPGSPRGGVQEERSVVAAEPTTSRAIGIEVNGERYERDVPARKLLVHFIRDDLDLTGTHIGCDTGNCGACTVIVDGDPVKSCMLLAVQADGASVLTVEGLAPGGELTPLQRSFNEHHALQCGYCTPGMLMSATALLERNSAADRGGRPLRAPGEHLPLHRLREHRRGRGRGRGRGS